MRAGRTRAGAALVALAFSAAVLTGCGDQQAPGDRAPGLEDALVQVETALAEGETEQARTQLGAIVDQARDAKDSGTLTSAEADAIIVAATDLLDELPDPPAPSPTPPPVEEDDDEEPDKKDREDKDDKGKKDDRGKGKDKRDKDDDDDDEDDD